MAIDVFTLLTLPSSPAFTKFRASGAELTKSETKSVTRSDSPPRKTPRLAADSDSASASRSRAAALDRAGENKGPVVISLLGPPVKRHPDSAYDNEYKLARAALRILLTPPAADNEREPLPATYEKIYASCRSVVTAAQKGDGLYEFLKQEVERCVGSLARSLLDEERQGVEWLVCFNTICEWFEQQVGLLQSLLAYLDRVYVSERKELQNIRTLAYTQFQQRIFGNSAIIMKMHVGIQTWIDWERENRAKHELRAHIPNLISHLEHHGVYHDTFETYFLEATRGFYAGESEQLRESMKPKEFLVHCENRHMEERTRAREIIPRRTISPLLDTVDKALLCDRLEWLSEGELPRQMDERQITALAAMYAMFARVNGQKVLQASFKIYVQNKVASIVKDTEHEDKMVERLLDFKAFCDRLVSEVFVDAVPLTFTVPAHSSSSDSLKASTSAVPIDADDAPPARTVPNQDFGYALIDAFQQGFRARRNKPAEMIAKYLDKAMRKGQKGKDDSTFAGELNRALALYRFTDDKDVFRTFYHRALAKRLLLEKSASDDFEKSVLKKLKEEYDPEFSMGDYMFKDLDLSRGMMKEYAEHRERLGDDSLSQKLSVMVLQRSFWPFSARKTDAELPIWMQEELRKYTTFYKSKHQGHKLDWDHSLGTATLRAQFSAGEKELSVSLYQAIILLMFNETDELPFVDIKTQTRMDDGDLRRTLQSLACGKKRVLKKNPAGKDVHDGDIFVYNADFTDPAFRVHINSIQVKETPEESKRTQTLIEADRKFALDAAIVRIMKGKKEMSFQDLVQATVAAVKNHFSPDVPIIKQRIDSLVEQDYLTRKDDNRNVLVYVA